MTFPPDMTPAMIQRQRYMPGSQEEHDQILDRYTYHVPTPEQRERLEYIGERFATFMSLLLSVIPDSSRERSLALTAGEEFRMRFNQAIVFSDPPIDTDLNAGSSHKIGGD